MGMSVVGMSPSDFALNAAMNLGMIGCLSFHPEVRNGPSYRRTDVRYVRHHE